MFAALKRHFPLLTEFMLYAHCRFNARRLISSSFLNFLLLSIFVGYCCSNYVEARHFIAITFDPYVKGTKSSKIKIK